MEAQLLDAFRNKYRDFESRVSHTLETSFGDAVLIERLGDELQRYNHLLLQYPHLFAENEFDTLTTNVVVLLGEIHHAYQQSVEASHSGRPIVIQQVRNGCRGRPRVLIDPVFLQWAIAYRGASAIARYLGCGRTTVRNALLEYGLSEPGRNPFRDETGDLQQPRQALLVTLDGAVEPPPLEPIDTVPVVPSTARISVWSDDHLDDNVRRLRIHFPHAGLSMLDSMLRQLGQRVPMDRIRQSLTRIDPVGRVFGRSPIMRREYHVSGPNSLWHNDGQHGLIRYGVVTHGIIDGSARFIVGLRASNNNRAETVMGLFSDAVQAYGVPSWVRGDHGTENLMVAAWMQEHNGPNRGSYIWGRSVHNIRIERLWVDVTAQFGSKWRVFFISLEVNHGLAVDNTNHKWLLHYLFLSDINSDCEFFAQAWNNHKIRNRGRPARSPAEMWGFDQIAFGVRGINLNDGVSDGDLEHYGVDWDALQDDRLIASNMANNPPTEAATSWIGRTGPPPNLTEVPLSPPAAPLTPVDCDRLFQRVAPFLDLYDTDSLIARWTVGLAFCRQCNLDF